MKPQSLHAQEDRLLDFAYGELPPTEAQAVESHVEGCSRCSELLADIRGVRTTMAQLPLEPAPDAGLESLLAYAQQAARNAAAGPAPKPTWWRRWMLPVVGVAAVCTFGIISIQVSKSVNLRPDLSAAKTEAVREAPVAKEEAKAPAPLEPPAAAAPAPVVQVAPAPMPSTPAANAAPAQTEAAASAEGLAMQEPSTRDSLGATQPQSYPEAKLDGALLGKEGPRKKAFVSGPKAPAADYSNVGTGGGFAHGEGAKQQQLAAQEKNAADKALKDEEYQNDAMTQMRSITKSKTLAMGSTRGDVAAPQAAPEPAAMPAPVSTPLAEEAPATGADNKLAERAEQQQMPSQGSSLRLNSGRTRGAPAPSKAAADAPADDFDDLFASKKAVAKREQQAPAAAPPPPPPVAAAAPKPSPMPAVSTAAPSSMSAGGAEAKGRSVGSSVAELSQRATEAFKSGNRVREAQLLAQALDAGATGSERLGLLNRLCEAQFAIGQREAAFQTCNLVLEEGPRSGAAQMAQRRLSRETEADDAKARPGARASKKAAPAPAEMEAAPASAPVQAQ